MEEVNKRAFLFGRKLVPMCTTLPLELLGSMRTSLAPSTGSKDLTDHLGVRRFLDDLLPNGRELIGGDNHRSVFVAESSSLVLVN